MGQKLTLWLSKHKHCREMFTGKADTRLMSTRFYDYMVVTE